MKIIYVFTMIIFGFNFMSNLHDFDRGSISNQNSNSGKEFKILKNELKECKESISILNSLKLKFFNIQQQLLLANNKNANLENQIIETNNLKLKVNSLAKENSNLKNNIKNLTEQNGKLKNQTNSLNSEFKNLKMKLSGNENLKENLNKM